MAESNDIAQQKIQERGYSPVHISSTAIHPPSPPGKGTEKAMPANHPHANFGKTSHISAHAAVTIPTYFERIIGVVLFLLGCLGLIDGIAFSVSAYQLERSGKLAQAMILKRTKDADGNATAYYLTYQFQALSPGEKWYMVSKEREEVSRTLYNRVNVEDKMTIVYARENPSYSHIQGNYDVVVFGMPLPPLERLLPTLIVLLLVSGMAYVKRDAYRLKKAGNVTTGSIIGCWHDDDSETYLYRIVFQFTVPDPSGEMTDIVGTAGYYRQYKFGDAIRVRFLPAHPSVFTLE